MKNELDESYCLFGAQTLLKRLRDLIQEIDGVRQAEDIEHLHRMRVASRRIRSTLALFEECFPQKMVKTWRKQMRRVTRTLGDARDADVQIDFLETFLDSLEEARYRAGIKRLLLRIRQQREGLQRKVITVMDRLEASDVLENIEETLRQIRIHGRLNQVDVHTSLVYQQACLAISLKLDEMLAYEPYVRQPERVEELHAMRIAAKRLRYTIEVFEPLYHEELKSSRQVVREVQTILGDIHDYDVWVEYLPQFLEEERVRTLEYFGHTRPLNLLKAGILYLQQECQQRRDQRYKEFVEFWEELQHQAVWENLGQILHARRQDK
ncbi:CHAD domain-containing protein [Candidatus Poribacteria bacterium]|nr:CHAD domain-containing protein [Candidatus Poribacteria bacterium]